MVRWLRLHTAKAGAEGSIPGGGIKIPRAVQRGQKIKKIIIIFKKRDQELKENT